MASRPKMTNADYVAIAVSPPLIMALIGSLVFFLIEVLYVGTYEIRLNYVFALFVFATVLIARIAIEFGAEHAAKFSLPLGVLSFLALQRFVEHPSPVGWLINLLLLAVVWWCAHKLTWDCTLIDDNEDASGEGLLGQVGLDETATPEPTAAKADNELFADGEKAADKPSWWRRVAERQKAVHTPGVWVLYFSLAALPLFGIGQSWIPASDVGRRRYAFGLLAVYVAAALSLLVTTSFLSLRRYLRQRRVEMPGPMAATWVSLGAVLILIVMFTAALIPRPDAEYALSRIPWQAGSPEDNAANRYSVGSEGTQDPEAQNRVTSDQQQGPPTGETGDQESSAASEQGDGRGSGQSKSPQRQQGGQGAQQGNPQPSDSQSNDANGEQQSKDGQQSNQANQTKDKQGQGGDENKGDPSSSSEDQQDKASEPDKSPNSSSKKDQGGKPGGANRGESQNEQPGAKPDGSAAKPMLEHAAGAPSTPPAIPQVLQSLSMGIGNLLKLLFYALLAALVSWAMWRNREALLRAMRDILRQIREFFAGLFGGRRGAIAAGEEQAAAAERRRTFAEFTDPFATGRHNQLPPKELVRYTFEAFEAWAGDRGRPRLPHETPQELVRAAIAPQMPMFARASAMVRLYGEAAYASANISREAALGLQPLWQMMRSQATSPEQT